MKTDDVESALEPAKGLGLLPEYIDGRKASALERVRAAADRLATWNRDVNALAHAIVNHPTLRREIRGGESAIAFATRKLLETPR